MSKLKNTLYIEETPTIRIIGKTGSGKSSLAFAIEKALGSHGINGIIVGCEDEKEGAMEKSWEARIACLKNREVIIETVRTLPPYK